MADWTDVPTNLLGTPREPEWAHLVADCANDTARQQGRDHLGGTCYENSQRLARTLHAADVDATVTCGWLDLPRIDTPPRTPADARDHPCLHYWVEVPSPTTPYVCELAAEVDNLFHPAIFPRRPQQYKTFNE